MGLLKKAVFLIICWFIGKFILSWLLFLGVFSHIYNHQPGPCRTLPGIQHGSEDAQATSDGLLFVTSGMKHLTKKDNPNFKDHVGQIMLVDTKAENTEAVPLVIEGGLDRKSFSPHGISLWRDTKSGNQYVYVVNHRGERDYIEKFLFDYKTKHLKYLSSFTSDDFGLINDLVVVGADKFYYTNWHYFRSVLGYQLELFLSLKWGGIGYYDGSQFSMVVPTGLAQPNGINVSPDHKYLYVVENLPQAFYVYQINQDGSITNRKEIPVHTIADNIDVDQTTGDIYLGCHPIPYRTLPYLDHPSAHNPPSQVLRVKMEDGSATDIEEIYSDDGHLIFGSTVAVYVSGRLYIGTVYHKMAECDVKYMS